MSWWLIFIHVEELEEMPVFVEYDDNNISHALAGPEYGQPWGEGWTVESSWEYIAERRFSFTGFKVDPTLMN